MKSSPNTRIHEFLHFGKSFFVKKLRKTRYIKNKIMLNLKQANSFWTLEKNVVIVRKKKLEKYIPLNTQERGKSYASI